MPKNMTQEEAIKWAAYLTQSNLPVTIFRTHLGYVVLSNCDYPGARALLELEAHPHVEGKIRLALYAVEALIAARQL